MWEISETRKQTTRGDRHDGLFEKVNDVCAVADVEPQ